MLRDASYMRKTIAVYGREHVKPKTHWVFDIADQLEEHAWLGILFDAFTIERFHVRVKRTAVDVKRNNQQSADFERYDCSKADCSKASTLQSVW